MEGGTRKLQVDRFIMEQIDSVPHLEALLLLFNNRPRTWTADEMARSLYVRSEVASKILDNLVQRKLISISPDHPGCYIYDPNDEEKNTLMESVDTVYRKEVIRISSMIHSKAPAGVLDFARAFRITKDKE
jgi:predicted ArsR family transcriptional regulator